MRIVIDAQSLIEPLAGIGRYARCLLETFAKMPPGNEFHLFYGASLRQWRVKFPEFDNPDFHPKLIKFPGKIYRALTEKYKIAPPLAFMGSFDLFHGLNYYVPRVKYPSIVNIYDMSFALHPQFFTRERLSDIPPKAAVSSKRADRIITGSIAAKSDIVDIYNVPEDKVVVIPNGVEERFRPRGADEIELYRKRSGLPDKFLLYVGTVEPRKNITALAKAYKKLRLKDVSLVIAGAKGWLYDGIVREIGELNLGERVIFTGRIPEEDLPLIYCSSLVFVYPSVYEGFGFPPLEAMACGAPVITGDRSSLPEIVGDAGLCVDPENVDILAGAMEYLLADEGKRRELAGKGIERAKGFSWKRCADKTMALYRELAGG